LTAQKWDAEHYNQSFSFIWQYGVGVLDLLAPQSGERVLDIGCGTGHLTAQIAEQGAKVIGIDHSAEMIQSANETYPEIEFHQADAANFSFDEPFDAVFSNATLHWVHPPERALECIYSALKPAGRFVAEFGGHRNVGRVVQALVAELEEHGFTNAASRNPWYFPTIAEYTALLEQHGLEPTFARLYDRPTLLDGGEDGLTGWLTMFGDAFFAGVPEEEQTAICEGVAERLRPDLLHEGNWYADYRRLQVVGVRK
jgi:trans-aconitate methyltransferase